MFSHKQVAVLRFGGARFEERGLDVDVLPEIVAYKRLLQETTKEIWRRKNPKRVGLPTKLDAEITLKFFDLQAGSAAVPLMRELPPAQAPHLYPDDELDEAAILLEDAIRAAEKSEGVPNQLPRSIIPLFADLGKTLREGEFLLVSAGTRDETARYDDAVKERILAWAAPSHTDVDRSLWTNLASIGAAVPEDVWKDIPRDLSTNADRYLYGRKEPH
jgi:hypothetical protein